MPSKAPPSAISTAHHGRCKIKTTADGALVSLENAKGIHIATVGRETAIKIGWLLMATQN